MFKRGEQSDGHAAENVDRLLPLLCGDLMNLPALVVSIPYK